MEVKRIYEAMRPAFARYLAIIVFAATPISSVAHQDDEAESVPVREIIGDVGDVSFPISISSARLAAGNSPFTSGCPLTRLFQRPKRKPRPPGSPSSMREAIGDEVMTPPGRSKLPVRIFKIAAIHAVAVPNSTV